MGLGIAGGNISLNLHPGARAALTLLSGNELDVARLVQSDELPSPQPFKNMALFKIRITGTGASHRPSLDEYVYRKPENYLTDEFLARCSGLPVIWEHPEKSLLNSEEFGDRIIGTVMLPYIEGNEVWAIARIYDAGAIESLMKSQLSTSPGVLLDKSSKKRKMDDGSTLLVEGEPSLLDHIAIVPNGVWDKGEGPTGVASTQGDLAMADEAMKEEDKKADAARMDADAKMDTALDSIRACADAMAGIGRRMDAMEENFKKKDARKDASEKEEKKEGEEERKDTENIDGEDVAAARLAADKAKKDSAEKEEKERKDASEDEKEEKERKDSVGILLKQNDELRERLARLETDVRKPVPADRERALSEAQSYMDSVAVAHGSRAPAPMTGESEMSYRRRLLTPYQKMSETWKDIDLSKFDATAFAVAEKQIRNDALKAASNPSLIPANTIRERSFTDGFGHHVTEFQGSEDAHFVKAFTPPGAIRRGRLNIGKSAN